MEEKQSAEKTTIQAAARCLGVSTKTIQRYLAKGLLTKIKDGAKTFVLTSEIDALAAPDLTGQKHERPRILPRLQKGLPRDEVVLEREHYESLLIELGELRKQKEYALEFKTALNILQDKLSTVEDNLTEAERRLKSAELSLSTMERKLSEAVQGGFERETDSKSPKGPKPWWQK